MQRPELARRETAPFIYIHMPFCEQRCTYCDFFTITDRESAAARSRKWLEAIRQELDLWRGAGDIDPAEPLRSIYFGGGTPSLTPGDAMQTFLDSVRDGYAVAPDAEITIEMQPGTADPARLEAYANAGINRFSVGAQSFDPAVLAMTGRNHTPDTTRQMLRELQGLGSLSIDMIAAWPGQTSQQWNSDLQEALAWKADHYSVYELTFKPGTEMDRQLKRGALVESNEELRLEMFEATHAAFESAGYEHYEISNYAKPGRRSRHNEAYWKLENFAGLGAGAHSFVFPHRYVNASSASDYLKAIGEGRLFRRESDSADPLIFLVENLQMALRLTDGVDLDWFAKRFGTDMRELRGQRIEYLVEGRLLEISGAQMVLTALGRARHDSIAAYLLG